MAKQIFYSDKYCDETFEYRHVVLPKMIAKMVPRDRVMTEQEWRSIGVQQSRGWTHYAIHKPEPHILLFRRLKGFQSHSEQEGGACNADTGTFGTVNNEDIGAAAGG